MLPSSQWVQGITSREQQYYQFGARQKIQFDAGAARYHACAYIGYLKNRKQTFQQRKETWKLWTLPKHQNTYTSADNRDRNSNEK